MENRNVQLSTNFGMEKNLLSERKRKYDQQAVFDYNQTRMGDQVGKKLRTNLSNGPKITKKNKKKQRDISKKKKVDKMNQCSLLSHLKLNAQKKVKYPKKTNSSKCFKLQKSEPHQIEFNVCGNIKENKIVQKLEQKIVNQKKKQDLLVNSMDFLQKQKRDLKLQLKQLKQLYKFAYNKEYLTMKTKDKKDTMINNTDSVVIPKIQNANTRQNLITTLKNDQLTIVNPPIKPFQPELFFFKEENRF
ncbi:hypothetical protein M0813_22767 [Anaeramoeba flamelloides]|uniref:Uncharacterized protein n=1 Tax=Anaeramoeba flamelloides TaxID=1746091 RepID=A0ABQ8YCL1_9EUKA|nr:hypothetical protein M0813_22767 [Anaeramoeba flamelloides]